jgi:tRNA(fMet)-specific endonuclease VapC
MKVLLGTNICIYMIKNNPPEVRKHFELFSPGEVYISSITVAELRYGVEKSLARGRNASALEAFLLPLEIISFDMNDALAYGSIRSNLEKQGTPTGSMDMLIAAQSVARELTLITNNMKEFQRISSLRCENWAQ